jgi:uncharacterized membrane protein YjjB (DUF3815 family)
MINIVFQTIAAFAATTAFSMLFNVPRKELVFCGITGAVGWFVSRFVLYFNPAWLVFGTFAGTLALTSVSRALSYSRKTPVLVYLIGGILPLVPGAGIYNTMYELIMVGEDGRAFYFGLQTAQVAGVIAVGIICVLSLPRILFDYSRKNQRA